MSFIDIMSKISKDFESKEQVCDEVKNKFLVLQQQNMAGENDI